jgi:hypothetical protein
MASTYYTDIQKMYVAYFARPADVAGLQYWEGVIEANKGSTAAVAAAFAQSTEYQSTYAGLDNAHVVNAVYQNLFGHAADAAGLDFWSKALTSGAVTVANAVTTIGAGAQGTDLVALRDKVIAANAFTTELDTPAEIAAYTGTAANQVGKAFLAQVIDDVSLLHAFDLDALKTIFVTLTTPATGSGGADHAAAVFHDDAAHVAIVGTPVVQVDHLA